jgi:hypothetical protein
VIRYSQKGCALISSFLFIVHRDIYLSLRSLYRPSDPNLAFIPNTLNGLLWTPGLQLGLLPTLLILLPYSLYRAIDMVPQRLSDDFLASCVDTQVNDFTNRFKRSTFSPTLSSSVEQGWLYISLLRPYGQPSLEGLVLRAHGGLLEPEHTIFGVVFRGSKNGNIPSSAGTPLVP